MSRIGKKPIAIPAKVDFSVDGQVVTVKGPKGQLTHTIPETISIEKGDNGEYNLVRANDERQNRALHGLTRALVANMVAGVSTGFRKSLIIEGTGYVAEMRNGKLIMKLGYSHEIPVEAPAGITFEVEVDNRAKTNKLHVVGIDKQKVGQVAADIRSLRPPEPYKGKGVRYTDEVVRRKAGKAGKTGKK